MGEGRVTGKDLIELGFRPGPVVGLALRAVPAEAALGANEVARRLRSPASTRPSYAWRRRASRRRT